jgi:hypothetical protein
VSDQQTPATSRTPTTTFTREQHGHQQATRGLRRFPSKNDVKRRSATESGPQCEVLPRSCDEHRPSPWPKTPLCSTRNLAARGLHSAKSRRRDDANHPTAAGAGRSIVGPSSLMNCLSLTSHVCSIAPTIGFPLTSTQTATPRLAYA